MTITAQEAYERLAVPKATQGHMLRVAAVAAILFDSIAPRDESLSGRGELISACLLHDTGNILKTGSSMLPQFFEPEGLAYWMEKREAIKMKYGEDVDAATIAMAREIGCGDRTIEIIRGIGYWAATDTERTQDIVKMIANYADMRVPPQGVGLLQDRLSDIRTRYAAHPHWLARKADVEAVERALFAEECALFERSHLSPRDITEDFVQNMIKQLTQFTLV